jgi:hypothetical protein
VFDYSYANDVAAFVPTGWPDGVHPPGTPGFEQTAVNWLLDVVPPDYRLHGVLVRHPVALATLARHHLTACVEGARQGYRCARAELGSDLPPGGLVAVLSAYQAEGRRLVATARAVDLVSRALRGESFVPQMAGAAGRSRTAASPADPETRSGQHGPPQQSPPGQHGPPGQNAPPRPAAATRRGGAR